jgi:sulfur carrier protein
MELMINGENRDLPEGLTAAQLVETLGLQGKRIAMEVNHNIVPRSRYGDHTLQPGDRIEIVHAVGGG